ncbi:sterol desaturase family protein [Parerythrobacter aurantius]|uniref:sterol desaturase family protein n=1 Tax=Parerythrobacter aurantius TaxID=3127706 RepID=UPI0032504D34
MTGILEPIPLDQLPSLVRFAIPAFVLAIIVEILLVVGRRRGDSFEMRDAAASLATGTLSTIIGGATAFAAVAIAMATWELRILTLPINLASLVLLFVIDDLAYYWGHRTAHRVRWFWANHVVHHSSQYFNLTTALRQPWFANLTGHVVFKLPLVLVGFHPLAIVFVSGINLIYQFWIHTETIERMPRWFEAVFNTPSHHRVHHARNPRYLDRNYAGTLIIWDRLFGTFVAEDPVEPPRFGIIRNIGSFNPLRIATHEFREIWRDQLRGGIGWRHRLAYLFAPPGWSHDGSRQTSDQIKDAAVTDLSSPTKQGPSEASATND